jgi:hypothetical protein
MEARSGRKCVLALLAFTAGLVPAAPAACTADEEVRVTVVVILATDRDKVVDDKLREIAEAIRKLYPSLTGFRMGPMTCKSVRTAKRESFELVEGQTATVVVLHGADEDDMVCLKLKAPGWREFTYSTVCGKFFPVMTHYQTKDKDQLWIAIAVHPCAGKEKKR